MTPELDSTSWMASTLKLEKVAPPISGSVVSTPSMEKTVVEPRWPLTANCCVKLAAPLASVMVPAARRRSLLKSREFRGRLETLEAERRSPPLACGVVEFWSWIETKPFSGEDKAKLVVSRAPSVMAMEAADWKCADGVTTEIW